MRMAPHRGLTIAGSNHRHWTAQMKGGYRRTSARFERNRTIVKFSGGQEEGWMTVVLGRPSPFVVGVNLRRPLAKASKLENCYALKSIIRVAHHGWYIRATTQRRNSVYVPWRPSITSTDLKQFSAARKPPVKTSATKMSSRPRQSQMLSNPRLARPGWIR